MDRFYFVALMLYAIRNSMTDCPVAIVLAHIDSECGMYHTIEDLLEIEYAVCLAKHRSQGISYGKYDKCLDDNKFSERVLQYYDLV